MNRPSSAARIGAIAYLSLSALTTAAYAATPHPQIPMWDAAAIEGMCDADIAGFNRMKTAMEAKKGPAGIFDEWNRLSIAIGNVDGPMALIANVSTDKATRDAADACSVKYAPFTTELFQSEALYERVKGAKPVDAIQRQYRQDLLENFEDSGVTLDPAKRERVRDINKKITDLALQFEKNIRDDGTKVTMTPAEMAGMPASYLAEQKKDDHGNYVLTLAYPSYVPFLQLATNGDARKRYWFAKLNEGKAVNLDLLNQVVALRLELAKLYGDPDFATYVVKRRMAGSPQAIYKFLDDVKAAVADLEKAEVAELRQMKADDLKQPLEQTRLDRWDVTYYQEKLKKARYDVDQEALRKYFPTEASIAYTLRVAETLYGIRFVPSTAPTWHPDVRVFDVYDRVADGEDGAFVGTVYLDLFPREGKYNHAAAWSVRSVSTLAKEPGRPGYRTPISALVTNFNRTGLDHRELETMLHEFGHVMHGVLSKTRYNDEAGTAVKRDFVEAPSQMFEEWARREDALKLFAEVCKDCPQLTHDQIDRLDAARKYGRGIRYARQLMFASYDMSLTTPNPADAMGAWTAIEGPTPLGTYPGTILPASFGHIMGGYAAGYYGYMWSEVLALDMLSGFHGKLMNPVDGKRYRTDVLSQGGQEPPEKLVEKFLGRKPNSDAFFDEVTGKR
ncbi:MAG: M3 family metallopeptidase [Burkholderiaceae bacterium]